MVDCESETLRRTQSPRAIETARDRTPPCQPWLRSSAIAASNPIKASRVHPGGAEESPDSLAPLRSAGTLAAPAVFRLDVADLVFHSNAVVLAERRGVSPDGVTAFGVKKVYRGPFLPEQEIRVRLRGTQPSSLAKPAPEWLLFLDQPSFELDRPGAGLELKILAGGLVPVEDEAARASYEAEIRRSNVRVESYRTAVGRLDQERRHEELLKLLGPLRPPPVFFIDHERYPMGSLEASILQCLGGSLRRTLEAISLLQTGTLPWLEKLGSFEASEFLRASMDRGLPAPLRVAAVRAMGNFCTRSDDARFLAALPGLLADPEADVRRAAAVHLAYRPLKDEDAGSLQSFVNAYRAEADPFVRIVFLQAAALLGVLARVHGPVEARPVAIEAGFRGLTVFFSSASPRGFVLGEEAATFRALARSVAGGAERASLPFQAGGPFRYEGRVELRFDPPLPPGAYLASVEGRWTFGNQARDLLARSGSSEITIAAEEGTHAGARTEQE